MTTKTRAWTHTSNVIGQPVMSESYYRASIRATVADTSTRTAQARASSFTHQNEHVEALVGRHVFGHAQNAAHDGGDETLEQAHLRAAVACNTRSLVHALTQNGKIYV